MTMQRKGLIYDILRGLLAAITTLFIIYILLHVDYFNRLLDSLDGMAYDFTFKCFKAKLAPSKEIIIVEANSGDDTIDRNKCYQLIDQLVHTRAKVIAFDILFKKTNQHEIEQQIRTRCETSGKTIHSFSVYGKYSIDDYQFLERHELAAFNALKPISFEFSDDHEPLEFEGGRIKFPFDTMLYVPNGLGHVNFLPDNDNVTRRFPLIITYDRKYYPGLALQIFRKYYNIADTLLYAQLSRATRSLTMLAPNNDELFTVPLNRYAQTLINFIPENRFRNQRMPWREALLISKQSDSNDFNNKIVLVIKSEGDNFDFSATPLSKRYPNWLIHASILSQVLQNRHIEESASGLFLLTFIAVFAIIIWLLFFQARLNWLKSKDWLILIISLVMLFGVTAIFINIGIWPGFIIPGIAMVASYFSTKLSLIFIPQFLKYHNFELQVQKKIKSVYLVDLIESPAGEAHEGEFKLDFKSFKKILLDLQSLNADRPHVRNFGTDLFDAIFQDQVKSRYYESLGIFHRSRYDRLRIQLRLESPELSKLPWEYLYDPQRRMHLALDKKISIARYPMIARKAEPLEVEPPIKILVLISSPSGYDALNVENEITKIEEELKKSRLRKKVQLEIIKKTTVEIVREKVHDCHVIHYIGHGGFAERQKEEIGALIFENESGGGELIDAERFSLMLCNTKVRLVILNACETAKISTYNAFLGVAPALISAGIPAAIAMQFAMPDSSAIIFSEEFYRSLAKDYHVDAALTDTRIAMAERIGIDRIDWGIPVLFMRSPDGLLFRPKS